MHIGSGIRNEKNQRSAASLYIAPGFAHMRSIVSAYGLIWNFYPGRQASSVKLDNE